MRIDRRACIILAAVFLAVMMAPGLIQTVSELWDGEQPRALDIFLQPPTARNLHEYEQSLEETSLVVKQLRPWMQYLQWRFLADAGEKAVVGRHGWLFYRPSVRYLVERQPSALGKRFRGSSYPRSDRSAISSGAGDPVAGRAGAQQGERLSRDARQAGRGRGTSSSASRRVVCSISWSSAALSTLTCLRCFAVPSRREPVGLEAALPGAGQPLVAGGCTVGRQSLSRGECSMQAPSIRVIGLMSNVRSPSGATAIWLR